MFSSWEVGLLFLPFSSCYSELFLYLTQHLNNGETLKSDLSAFGFIHTQTSTLQLIWLGWHSVTHSNFDPSQIFQLLGYKGESHATGNDSWSHSLLVFAVCYSICLIFLISPSDPDFPDSIASHAGLMSWREERPAPVFESCATAGVLQADVSTGAGWGLFPWMNYDRQSMSSHFLSVTDSLVSAIP